MAATKIVSFLRSDRPGVLALVGPTGCGKRHAIAEVARQAGVAVTHHDVAQGAIEWGRLGSQQLTPTGLSCCVHAVSNASEQFLKDFAFAKKTQAKIILVADDAGKSIRTSGVPVVRMQAMNSDAMAKKLSSIGQLRRPLLLLDTRRGIGTNCIRAADCAQLRPMGLKYAQKRTRLSQTHRHACLPTNC